MPSPSPSNNSVLYLNGEQKTSAPQQVFRGKITNQSPGTRDKLRRFAKGIELHYFSRNVDGQKWRPASNLSNPFYACGWEAVGSGDQASPDQFLEFLRIHYPTQTLFTRNASRLSLWDELVQTICRLALALGIHIHCLSIRVRVLHPQPIHPTLQARIQLFQGLNLARPSQPFLADTPIFRPRG